METDGFVHFCVASAAVPVFLKLRKEMKGGEEGSNYR